MKMGVSNFGVSAQIWALGPNLKIKSNRIFNVEKKTYSLVRIDLIVFLLESLGVVTGV